MTTLPDERRERLTDLELLRLGAPGKPRQVEVARRMRLVAGRAFSAGHMSSFESGAVTVSDDFLRAYAKALGVPTREVERRYLITRMAYCRRIAKQAKKRLADL